MSIRPRRTNSALILALGLAFAQGCDGPPAPPLPPPGPTARPEPPAAARNPIEVALTAEKDDGTRREGTAILILVDATGSMNDPVLDTKGVARRKMEIAGRCVSSLVRQAEKFSKEHPEAGIVLGIEEFSLRSSGPPCRTVVPMDAPNEARAAAALNGVSCKGGTPIGDAVMEAKLKLDRAGYRKNHILVITDGQNTSGYAPADVVNVITRLPEERRASLYFIAFDVAAEYFTSTREAGALVLGASNERELQQTLDYVLTGKILAEQTAPPAGK